MAKQVCLFVVTTSTDLLRCKKINLQDAIALSVLLARTLKWMAAYWASSKTHGPSDSTQARIAKLGTEERKIPVQACLILAMLYELTLTWTEV